MSICIVSDNRYFFLGAEYLGEDVKCMTPLEVLSLNDSLGNILWKYKIDTILVSSMNHNLMKNVLSVVCKIKFVAIFLEIPSSVEAKEINVCGIVVLNRKVTSYILAGLKNFNPAKMDRISSVDFSKINTANYWTTAVHLQSGMEVNALAHKMSLSKKTLSYRKLKIASEMHIRGVNTAMLLKLMNTFMHIYAIKKSTIPMVTLVDAKIQKKN